MSRLKIERRTSPRHRPVQPSAVPPAPPAAEPEQRWWLDGTIHLDDPADREYVQILSGEDLQTWYERVNARLLQSDVAHLVGRALHELYDTELDELFAAVNRAAQEIAWGDRIAREFERLDVSTMSSH